MNARDIQRRLIAERMQRSTCLPNFTPCRWFECDVFELTAAGYFVEYEIKLTRSDYKADALKHKRHWVNGECSDVNKHNAVREKKGPSRFYFVCPEHVIEQHMLPSWAGLIWAHANKSFHPVYKTSLAIQRRAPQLHRRRYEENAAQIYRTCYYRFLQLYLK